MPARSLEYVPLTSIDVDRMDERADQIAVIVRKPQQYSLSNRRCLWELRNEYKTPRKAREALARAAEDMRMGSTDIVLAIDRHTDETVGMGRAAVDLSLRRSRLPAPTIPWLLDMPGIKVDIGQGLGANVKAWVDMDRERAGDELSYVFKAMRRRMAGRPTWTVEPIVTVYDGIHRAITSAGFECRARDEGYYDEGDESKMHITPPGRLYTARPLPRWAAELHDDN